MTTDDFIQDAQATNISEEDAWNVYSQNIGGVSRQEFASCWIFWGSAIGHAIVENPEIVA